MGFHIFNHLNKLTYSMYMVSPIVITAAYGLKETGSHFGEADTVSEKKNFLVTEPQKTIDTLTFTDIQFAWRHRRQLFNFGAVCNIL